MNSWLEDVETLNNGMKLE